LSSDPNKSERPDKRLFIIEEGQKPSRRVSKYTVTAQVGRHIRFNTAVLDSFDVKGCESLHYDLLIVCAAVEFADRRWKRPQGWRRTLDLTVPVIDLKTWKKPDVLKNLHRVLNHLTGDTWRFTFVRAKNLSPIGYRQIPLDFGKTKTFAVAYSDGLDSRAVSALSGDNERALCIRLAGDRQRRRHGDSYFTHIPFKVAGYRGNESSFRSRAFQFAAVTAIAAQLSNVSRIVVPESGQGALGPVLLPLHNIYADYRNHPTFFRKMERFISAVQGHRVRFEQPRLWHTKAQTLRAFLELPGRSAQDLTSTRSCWQRRRLVNLNGRKQCGLCAACLLRRLSLHAAGISEPPNTYVVSDLTSRYLGDALAGIPQKADRDIMIEYGSVGARHLQHLADMATLPDEALRAHASQIAAATDATYDNTLKSLRTMLAIHAAEWRTFVSAQGEESFLTGWVDGGRVWSI
jgi:hypothetical protein